MINRKIEAILFDFDGTIADTSEDMVGCLNILLKNHSKEDVDVRKAKNFISKGAAGLINFAFPKIPDEEKKLYISESGIFSLIAIFGIPISLIYLFRIPK